MAALNGWDLDHSQEGFFVLTKGNLKITVSPNSGFRGGRGFICDVYKDGNLIGTVGSVEYAVELLEK